MTVRILKISILSALLLIFIGSSHALAAPTFNFTVGAVVLSKNQCRFLNNNITLDFGNLDPTSGANVNATTSVNFRCQGADPIASYAIGDDDGLHETGPDAGRMQHSVNPAFYIPYSLSMTPLIGNAPKNVDQVLTIDGSIAGADYQLAIPGIYTDLVVISILP